MRRPTPAGVTRRALIRLGVGALAMLCRPRVTAARGRNAACSISSRSAASFRRRTWSWFVGRSRRSSGWRRASCRAPSCPRRRSIRRAAATAPRSCSISSTGGCRPTGRASSGSPASTSRPPRGASLDWGLLGLGRIGGASSVISEFRCRMRSPGPANARERLAKVAVHEAGHTLGLEHCPTRGCLMEDAEGQVATCDREYDFCPRCRGLLAAAGRPLPPSPRIPWPRPSI